MEMEVINIELLKALISKAKDHAKISAAVRELNASCHLDVKCVKPDVVVDTAQKINMRERNSEEAQPKLQKQEQCINWGFGEFKIFVWVIIFQCLTHQIQLKDINEQIVLEIQSIFPSKLSHFIRYEVRLLMSYKYAVGTSWSKEEARLLERTIKIHSRGENINWRLVSFKLFCESNCRFFRNLNHCREKWNNHLNPQVKKSGWTPEEDIFLFDLIDKYGQKWSKISKSMDNTRTEHMVKNRYNRFMRIWKTGKLTSQLKTALKTKIEQHYKKSKRTRIEEEQFVKVQQRSCFDEQSPQQPNQKQMLNGTVENLNDQQMVKCQEVEGQKQSGPATLGKDAQKEGLKLQQNDHFYYPFLNAYFCHYPKMGASMLMH